MVDDLIIAKLGLVYSEILKEKKDIYVFAVLKMDNFIDKWSIVLSALWTEEESTHEEIFAYVVGILNKYLDPEELSRVARIGIFTPKEHFVNLITKSFRIESGPLVLKDTTINGNTVHEGYIFRSIIPSK